MELVEDWYYVLTWRRASGADGRLLLCPDLEESQWSWWKTSTTVCPDLEESQWSWWKTSLQRPERTMKRVTMM